MEEQGLPNAGFYDQRAALQWTHDYVSLLGGDPTQVSAWGESAGAGSILHQLVAFGGTQDPLFSKAVLQSPAFAFMWDRKGLLEDVFQNFTALAGCTGQGVACLRAASAETLNAANIALTLAAPVGTFAVGPAADGSFVRQLAVLEYASGNTTVSSPTFFKLIHFQAITGRTSIPSSSATWLMKRKFSSTATSKRMPNLTPSLTKYFLHMPKMAA